MNFFDLFRGGQVVAGCSQRGGFIAGCQQGAQYAEALCPLGLVVQIQWQRQQMQCHSATHLLCSQNAVP